MNYILTTIFLMTLLVQEDPFTLLKKGDTLPRFSLQTIEGQPITQDSLQNKLSVIMLFTLSCDPCLEALPLVDTLLWQKYADSDSVFVFGVGRDETDSSLMNYKKESALGMPLVQDPRRVFYSMFAQGFVPRLIIADPSGIIIYHRMGINRETLNEVGGLVRSELRQQYP